MARDYRYKHQYTHNDSYDRRLRSETLPRRGAVESEGADVSPFVQKKLSPLRVFIALSLFILTVFALFGAYFVITHFANKTVSNEVVAVEVVEPVAPKQIQIVQKEEIKPEVKSDGPINVKALPNPQTLQIPAIDYEFYDSLKSVEVVTDVEVLSVKLDRPHYLIAASFRDKARAEQEIRRFARHDIKLLLSESEYKGRPMYYLKSREFTDRLELNKTKNRLKSLGAHVLTYKRTQ